jgi:hypothetical protein
LLASSTQAQHLDETTKPFCAHITCVGVDKSEASTILLVAHDFVLEFVGQTLEVWRVLLPGNEVNITS